MLLAHLDPYARPEAQRVEELHDVDTVDDVAAVREASSPDSRFARATVGFGG